MKRVVMLTTSVILIALLFLGVLAVVQSADPGVVTGSRSTGATGPTAGTAEPAAARTRDRERRSDTERASHVDGPDRPRCTLRGYVTDPAGDPAPEVAVEAVLDRDGAADCSPLAGAGGSVLATTRTDPSGAFSLVLDAPGRVHPGDIIIRASRGTDGALAVPVHIGWFDGTLGEPIRLRLSRALLLRGVVVRTDGSVVPDAGIELEIRAPPRSFSGFEFIETRWRVRAGKDGRFTAHVPAGTIGLHAIGGGDEAPGPIVTRVVDVGDESSTREDDLIEVVAPSSLESVRLVVDCVDADGLPVATWYLMPNARHQRAFRSLQGYVSEHAMLEFEGDTSIGIPIACEDGDLILACGGPDHATAQFAVSLREPGTRRLQFRLPFRPTLDVGIESGGRPILIPEDVRVEITRGSVAESVTGREPPPALDPSSGRSVTYDLGDVTPPGTMIDLRVAQTRLRFDTDGRMTATFPAPGEYAWSIWAGEQCVAASTLTVTHTEGPGGRVALEIGEGRFVRIAFRFADRRAASEWRHTGLFRVGVWSSPEGDPLAADRVLAVLDPTTNTGSDVSTWIPHESTKLHVGLLERPFTGAWRVSTHSREIALPADALVVDVAVPGPKDWAPLSHVAIRAFESDGTLVPPGAAISLVRLGKDGRAEGYDEVRTTDAGGVSVFLGPGTYRAELESGSVRATEPARFTVPRLASDADIRIELRAGTGE